MDSERTAVAGRGRGAGDGRRRRRRRRRRRGGGGRAGIGVPSATLETRIRDPMREGHIVIDGEVGTGRTDDEVVIAAEPGECGMMVRRERRVRRVRRADEAGKAPAPPRRGRTVGGVVVVVVDRGGYAHGRQTGRRYRATPVGGRPVTSIGPERGHGRVRAEGAGRVGGRGRGAGLADGGRGRVRGGVAIDLTIGVASGGAVRRRADEVDHETGAGRRRRRRPGDLGRGQAERRGPGARLVGGAIGDDAGGGGRHARGRQVPGMTTTGHGDGAEGGGARAGGAGSGAGAKAVGPDLALEARDGGGQRVGGDVLVDVYGLGVLAQVVEAREASGAVTLKRTLAGMFPDPGTGSDGLVSGEGADERRPREKG